MSIEAVQPFQRVVQDIQGAIREGRLRAGEKLPSTRELALEHNVAPGTVQRALTELRTAGLVYSQQGRGTYVSDSAAEALEDPSARAIRVLEERVADLTARLERIEEEIHG